MSTRRIVPVSAIIPSIGRNSLYTCLHHLLSGSSIPAQIIVSIPPDITLPYHETLSSVSILTSPTRGQVYQRLHALQHASQAFILQLDDDVFLEEDTLDSLYDATSLANIPAVYGPTFYNSATGSAWHSFSAGPRLLIDNLYESLVHFLPWGTRRMGKVSISSYCWGVDPSLVTLPLVSVEWLAGGCVLCDRQFAIPYSPPIFNGKAFSEDLYFSYLRRLKGISHFVIPHASVFTPSPVRSLHFQDLLHEFRSRLLLVRSMNLSTSLFVLGFITDLVRSLMARLLKCSSS